MAYAATTFAQAKASLAALLADTGNVYWSDAEKGMYLRESLRTWNSLTNYWRERGSFSTDANIGSYDLPTELPSLLSYTVTDQELITAMEYRLLEPATPTVWTGTEQFTLADLTQALERRRNQFLLETGCVITFDTCAITPPIGRVTFSQDIIDVRRASWIPASPGTRSVMWRADEWSFTTANPLWAQTLGTPLAYSIIATPPLSMQLMPMPQTSGNIGLLTIKVGASLNPAVGVVMGVPDDFCWAIMFGALADVLNRDGPALDPQRAAYCEKRYQEGVAAARIGVSLIQGQINDVNVITSSLYDMDAYDPLWSNYQGQPAYMMMAGLNFVSLSPTPDEVYGVSMDVVRKAPLPTLNTDFLQVGQEILDAIYGYAQHLASFKMGGAEFEATNSLYDRFYRVAALQNERLLANADNFSALQDRAKQEEYDRPRRTVKR